jgi:hypothetical protein
LTLTLHTLTLTLTLTLYTLNLQAMYKETNHYLDSLKPGNTIFRYKANPSWFTDTV